jgi:archaellum component FlaG (FlaF/FlaG flagellin family)
MGFGNLATTLIMFIAVLLLATGVIAAMRTNIDKTQSSMRTQADFLNNQILTNTLITSVNYTADNLRVYALNNGKTTLKLDQVDIYVDDAFIPRNDTNRTIAIEASTDTKNPGLWDPDEIVRIDVTTTIAAGQHRAMLATSYGTKDEELFSI